MAEVALKAAQGLVSAVYGAYYGLRPTDERTVELRAVLRGRLRLEDRRHGSGQMRHAVIVGDRVSYRIDAEDSHLAHIEEVAARDNVLMRASARTFHALGANLDRAVLVAGLALPETPLRFVDRFLVSCAAGEVEPVLVWSKLDLVSGDVPREQRFYAEALGIRSYALDLVTGEPSAEWDALARELASGVTLLAGNSGTGKSTLLNRLLGREEQRTADISASMGKGRHTTTNPKMLASEEGRALYIDTPGVKEWGVLHLDRASILGSFPELTRAAEDCRFPNCEHQPGDGSCAVQRLLGQSRESEDGPLAPERLESLEAMLESLDYPDRVRYGDYVKPTGRLRDH